MRKTALWLTASLFLVASLVGVLSCKKSTRDTDVDGEKDKVELPADKNYLAEPVADNKIVVYQMMTRLFGNKVTNNIKWGSKEENGVGKFSDINDLALQELKKLGITHVWYTGVLEHMLDGDYTKFGIPLDDVDVVKGRAGSPYAIKDYYDVNPDLANDVKKRKEEFASLVKRTHANGLKVVIDFVPNHVARDYKSDSKPKGVRDLGEGDDKTKAFDVNNNFYYIVGKPFVVPKGNMTPGPKVTNGTKDGKFDEDPAKATGNDQFTPSPDGGTWFETIKLNYGIDIQNKRKKFFNVTNNEIPPTWKQMVDILIYWAKMDVDGFRCDMAEMVPVEFWGWAIPQVKAVKPSIVFIAEIYNAGAYKDYINKGKFDYLYDKVGLYDTLKPLMQGSGHVNGIVNSWSGLKGITTHMLRFLENHDEMRVASSGFAKDPWPGLPAMVVSATLSTGPVMIYFGQEVGEPGKGTEGFGGNDSRTSIFDYWGVPEHQKWMNNGKFDGGQLSDDQKRLRAFYAKLLNLCRQNAAIREGKFYDLYFANIKGQSEGWDDRKVYSYLRFAPGGDALLVAVNFDKTNAVKTVVKIPEAGWTNMGLPVSNSYTLTDILNGTDKSEPFLGSSTTNREDEKAGITLVLAPMSAYIFKIEEAK